MNLYQFSDELQDMIAENRDLRRENAFLKTELNKYRGHVSEELQFWNNTYGNILTSLSTPKDEVM